MNVWTEVQASEGTVGSAPDTFSLTMQIHGREPYGRATNLAIVVTIMGDLDDAAMPLHLATLRAFVDHAERRWAERRRELELERQAAVVPRTVHNS